MTAMHAPQIVVLEADGWIARHLGDVAAESAWVVRGTRGVDTAASLVRERNPCVLVVQLELADEKPASLRLIADLRRTSPDVPIVAVSDAKFNDADRVAWTAALFDLGARYALFPPLTQPVLEDVVSGLMAATIRRVVGDSGESPAAQVPKPKPRRAKAEEVIDLADEDVHE
jgi:DNA-binding response OmpR family regulator